MKRKAKKAVRRKPVPATIWVLEFKSGTEWLPMAGSNSTYKPFVVSAGERRRMTQLALRHKLRVRAYVRRSR